jgi:formylglycine-generating enzyme required for sulfatase activity
MEVSIESFYIGKYEVTQKQWKAVMGDNLSRVKGDDYPVTDVSWYEALEFVKRLSEDTGHTLPFANRVCMGIRLSCRNYIRLPLRE